MSPQAINQFGQLPLQGQIDQLLSPNTIPCVVDLSQSGQLVAGQAVKLVDNLGGPPKIIGCTADTDVVFGYINYSTKTSAYNPGDACQVSISWNVMYMTASAAIARGAPIKPVISGQKIVTAAAGNLVSGYAFDKATANGDLIRVLIKGFGSPPATAAAPVFAQAADVGANATAAATDLATAEALANSLQTTVNAIRTNLRAAGLMA